MEPEHRQEEFVADRAHPVAPGDVQQFVRRHGGLLAGLERGEAGRDQDDGPADAERHGTDDLRRHEEAGVGAHEKRGRIDGVRTRVERHGGPAEPGQRDQPEGEPPEPGRDTRDVDARHDGLDGPAAESGQPGEARAGSRPRSASLGGEALRIAGRRQICRRGGRSRDVRRRPRHPGLQHRQRQADKEERPQVQQPGPGRGHAKEGREEHAGAGQCGDLQRPRPHVAEGELKHVRPLRWSGPALRVPSSLDADL